MKQSRWMSPVKIKAEFWGTQVAITTPINPENWYLPIDSHFYVVYRHNACDSLTVFFCIMHCITTDVISKYGVFTLFWLSGVGPIWLNKVKCKGDENDILDCEHGYWNSSSQCKHENDAGVRCHVPDIGVKDKVNWARNTVRRMDRGKTFKIKGARSDSFRLFFKLSEILVSKDQKKARIFYSWCFLQLKNVPFGRSSWKMASSMVTII